MPTRNVVITDRQAKLLDKLVAEGEYQNASEAMRDGLRLLEERRAENRARLKALREAAQVGITDFEAGRYVTFKDSKSLRAYLKTVGDRAIASATSKRAAE